MQEFLSPQWRSLLHMLNQRYRQEFDRAERLQAQLNDIQGSRAFVFFRWLRGLRRLFLRDQLPTTRDAPLSTMDEPTMPHWSMAEMGIAAKLDPQTGMSDSLEALLLSPPTVSIVIPFKDQLALLRNCLRSLRRGTYRRLEIVLVDNASSAPDMVRYLERMSRRRGFRVVRCPGAFNFARVCNLGAQHASGDYLLFLNNDVEVQSPRWLEKMLEVAAPPYIGIVGAAQLYPDGTIQHAGIEPNGDGDWQHLDRGQLAESLGNDIRSVSAVTAACMLIRRDRFLDLNGFNERFPVTLNDVDLCCRARQRGWLTVVTPHARLVHFESLSRGYSRQK